MNRKDDDEMDALLDKHNSNHHAGGQRGKSASAAHKALITRNLRLAYGEVAREPVPQRFMDLLDQIDGKGRKS